MSRVSNIGLSALLGVCVLAACTTTPEEEAERTKAQALLDAEISAHKGEAVSQICPRGSDGWKALGDNIVLLEARGDWYMAELSGTCDPDSAFRGIATRSGPGSSCLARGDRILTGPPRGGGRCTITALYQWNEDTEAAPSADATPVKE
jgi:hypothetical protein